MVSKDQSIGGAIFLICLVIAIFYVVTLFYPDWIKSLGWNVSAPDVRFWLVAIPVFIAFIAIMGIGAWIGWTMATTPPPKPIEEITSEIEEEEEAAKKAKETEETTETGEKKSEKGKGKSEK
jgi:predicted DNA-binding transcriptional regulator